MTTFASLRAVPGGAQSFAQLAAQLVEMRGGTVVLPQDDGKRAVLHAHSNGKVTRITRMRRPSIWTRTVAM